MSTPAATVTENKLHIALEPLISSMSLDQKREILAWLVTDAEVINSVVDTICGEDEWGWSSGDPNRRQEIIQRIEDKQLAEPSYNWKPWDELRQKLKGIRSSENIYWALYHKINTELSRQVIDEFHRLGVESNYTTAQADADIATIQELIRDTFAAMQRVSDTPEPHRCEFCGEIPLTASELEAIAKDEAADAEMRRDKEDRP